MISIEARLLQKAIKNAPFFLYAFDAIRHQKRLFFDLCRLLKV